MCIAFLGFEKPPEVTVALLWLPLEGPQTPRIPASSDFGIYAGSRNGTHEDNAGPLFVPIGKGQLIKLLLDFSVI